MKVALVEPEARDVARSAGVEDVYETVIGGQAHRFSAVRTAAVERFQGKLEGLDPKQRAAVEALVVAHPHWLAQRICVSDWTARYGRAMTAWRPPVRFTSVFSRLRVERPRAASTVPAKGPGAPQPSAQ